MTSPPSAVSGSETSTTMSTPETLVSIFFEPGRTFEALRQRPRFLAAALILIALATLVSVMLVRKVDFEEMMNRQMATNPRMAQMTPEQRETSMRIGKIVGQVAPPVAITIMFVGGAALYLLGAMAMGGKATYKQSLALWVYSSFPPAVLASLVSLVILFLKSSEDIDIRRPGGGLLVTNPSAFMSSDTSPIVMALLGALDLFSFYGLFLAATGLRRMARLPSASAWTVVLVIWVLGVIGGVIRAMFAGG